MSALNLRLPESLHEQVRLLSRQERVSINQFIALAVAEKVAAIKTLDYIEQRAKRGDRAAFDNVLEKIARSNHPPLPEDSFPSIAR